MDVKHNHVGRVCDTHCPAWRVDELTCLACGAKGDRIGFEHKCDPIAAREERARIVAWLRKPSEAVYPEDAATRVLRMATLIEAGAHLSSGSKR